MLHCQSLKELGILMEREKYVRSKASLAIEKSAHVIECDVKTKE